MTQRITTRGLGVNKSLKYEQLDQNQCSEYQQAGWPKLSYLLRNDTLPSPSVGTVNRTQTACGSKITLTSLKRFHTGSGAQLASCSVVIKGLFPRVNRPRNKDDHSPPFSDEVKNTRRPTSIPPHALLACIEITLNFF